jgi:hypothetical protein
MVTQDSNELETSTSLETILSAAVPSQSHGWLLNTAQVAEGYGVSDSTLRGHKSNKPDELKEGQHWIKEGKTTFWTQAGVIQLGFHVQSARGNAFRQMAEQLVLAGMAKQSSAHTEGSPLNGGLNSELDQIAQTVARKILPALQTSILEERIRHHVSAGLLQNLEAVGDSLGKSIGAMYGLDLSVEISQAIASYRSEARA